jgi:predicted TIM-barrel fold metal-dependent hydrolase
MIAWEYNKLADDDKRRLDPMITAFNPMDLYAVQHIKRVLLTNPGVFSGIGEFTVHKELVSDKTVGDPVKYLAGVSTPPDGDDTVTLYNPSLPKILDFTAEAGLVVVLHNDIYNAEVAFDGTVLSKAVDDPTYVQGLKYLCAASPNAKVIWAHTGLGRFVTPAADHLALVSSVLDACPNWSTDLSWDLVQHYILQPAAGQPATADWIAFINKYQDRVLFGSDNVFYRRTTIDSTGAVTLGRRQNLSEYMAVANNYQPLWDALGPTVARKIQRGNYETLYDAARASVRSWERAHASDDIWALAAE